MISTISTGPLGGELEMVLLDLEGMKVPFIRRRVSVEKSNHVHHKSSVMTAIKMGKGLRYDR